MHDPTDTLYYDGVSRPRSDVIARVVGDVRAFLSGKLDDFESDQSPWVALLHDVNVPEDLDPLPPEVLAGPPTIAWGLRVSMTEERVATVTLPKYFPKRLAAIHEALSTKPWCVSSRLREGEIALQLRRLDPETERRVVHTVRSNAARSRERMRSGVASLLGVIAPDAPAEITLALETSLRALSDSERAKLAALERL